MIPGSLSPHPLHGSSGTSVSNLAMLGRRERDSAEEMEGVNSNSK